MDLGGPILTSNFLSEQGSYPWSNGDNTCPISSGSNSNSSSSSNSPPVNSILAGQETLSRPTWLFPQPQSQQYQQQPQQQQQQAVAYTNPCTPTDALSSILDHFVPFENDLSNKLNAQYQQMTNRVSPRRPYGSLMSPGAAESLVNPLGAPGTPVNNSLSMPSTPSGNAPPPKNPKLYKTELCRTWMEYGRCNYGERCQYAHGENEKRPIPRHPKYKTEPCQSFHMKGGCPYGSRCHFIHKLEPLSSSFSSMFPASLMRSTNGPGGPAMSQTVPNRMLRAVSTVMLDNAVKMTPLHRMASMPNYGSAGESSSGSSADSGSESPNGSFSPGLDLEENGPFTGAGFMTPQQHLMQRNTNPNNFYSAFDSKYEVSGLLNDILGMRLDDSNHTDSGRLPVFTQLGTDVSVNLPPQLNPDNNATSSFFRMCHQHTS